MARSGNARVSGCFLRHTVGYRLGFHWGQACAPTLGCIALRYNLALDSTQTVGNASSCCKMAAPGEARSERESICSAWNNSLSEFLFFRIHPNAHVYMCACVRVCACVCSFWCPCFKRLLLRVTSFGVNSVLQALIRDPVGARCTFPARVRNRAFPKRIPLHGRSASLHVGFESRI